MKILALILWCFAFALPAQPSQKFEDTRLRLVFIDGSILRGILVGHDAQVVTLEVDNKAQEIPMEQIRKAFDVSTDRPYNFTVEEEIAPPAEVDTQKQETKAERRARINKELSPNVLNKSWYVYDAFGIASFKYPADVQNTLDANLAGACEVCRMSMSLEVFGFYYSWRPHNLLLGLVVDGGADSFESDQRPTLYVDEYLYAVSFMYFPWQGVGRGLFLRGDFGYARMVASSGYSATLLKHDGYGGLLGIGYAFPVARKFSIMITVDDLLLRMQEQVYDSPRLNVGILF